MNFWNAVYYGNSVGTWTIAFLTILLFIFLSRTTYYAIGKWVKRLTARTTNQLDDLLIDKLEEPVAFLIVLVGVRLALNMLTLGDGVGTAIASAYHLILALTIAWMIARTYGAIHETYLMPIARKSDTNIDDQLLSLLGSGGQVIIYSLAIIIGLNNAGYNVGAILAGLGIGGLAFALAAQDTVANLFGGIMIFIQRLFKLGDRIEIGDFSGFVVNIGVRSTTIQTLTGRLVVVPNRMFNEIPVRKVRWSQELYLVEQKLQLAKDSPPALLQQLKTDIEAIINANPYTAEPVVLLSGFTDFALEIEYCYIIAPWQAEDKTVFGEPYRKVFAVKSEINFQVLTKIHESGLRQTGLQLNAEAMLPTHLLSVARQVRS